MVEEDASPIIPESVFNPLCRAPAPILRSLDISLNMYLPDEDDWSEQPIATLPSNLFAGNAPMLSSVVFRGTVCLPMRCKALNNVTVLRLRFETRGATTRELSALDGLCPNLRALDMYSDEQPALPSTPSSLKLSSLSIRIRAYQQPAEVAAERILRHFSYQTIRSVTCSYFAGWFDRFWPPDTQDRSGPYTLSKPDRFSLTVVDKAERSITVVGIPRNAALPQALQDCLVDVEPVLIVA